MIRKEKKVKKSDDVRCGTCHKLKGLCVMKNQTLACLQTVTLEELDAQLNRTSTPCQVIEPNNNSEPSLLMMSCAIVSACSFVGTFLHVLFPTFFPVMGRKFMEAIRMMWSFLKKNVIKLINWLQKMIRAKPEMPPLDLECPLIKNQPFSAPSAPLDSDQNNGNGDIQTESATELVETDEKPIEEEDEELRQFASQFAN
ncbi:hypothetical protein CAEBREN_15161 [Caenorhabditis brenneri]|uniref:Uncharacterized protein n=1 Tax=Caenorhabditis brenneri TaxID=135651 RepID=G0PH91_CAEBE|nr:hypothetical protein CAEBREN_15161 [Caenorhabditis brenneri]